MRRAIQSAWSEGGWKAAALGLGGLPFEVLFRAGTGLRDQAYQWGLRPMIRVPIPVLSVGNVVVGGTGKTPVSAWLGRFLVEAGRSPALVTRGYGRDEIRLHQAWNPDVPVVADPNRVRGALQAGEKGADVVVLDDGFQHRRLARDLDVVLVAAEQPEAWRLLPRGPYREVPDSLSRADVVVLTHRTASADRIERWRERLRRLAPGALHASLCLSVGRWTDLAGEERARPSGDVLAVCSIASPASFATLVERELEGDVRMLAFADHHEYASADLTRLAQASEGRAIVTTEKDAVKLREMARPGLAEPYVMTLCAEWEAGQESLKRRMLEAIGESGA